MKQRTLIHDDDCGEPLDASGFCRRCGFYPDMQSTALVRAEPKRDTKLESDGEP
jgi:hypothetical protein